MHTDLGAWSEEAIDEGLQRAFGSDFVFRSPLRSDVTKPEEATDVLVLFGDVAIIVESKARAYRRDEPWRDADTGWAAKNLKDALKQLNRGARLFKEGKFATAKNVRRSISVDSTAYRSLYGLVILNHLSESYSAREVVPELAKARVPTIAMSLRDLLSVAHYLDTPADLINYLETRYEIDYPKLQPRVHEEATAFNYYANHMEQVTAVRYRRSGREIDEKSLEPQGILWRKALAGQLDDAKYGRFFDLIIDQLHKGAPNLGVEEFEGIRIDHGPNDYAKIATELAWYARIRRIAIGKRMMKCLQEAEAEGADHSFRVHSPTNETTIMFLASTASPDERPRRAADLQFFSTVAHISMRAKKTLGITTDARMTGPRSFDVALLTLDVASMPPETLAEGDRIAREVWGDKTRPVIGEIQDEPARLPPV